MERVQKIIAARTRYSRRKAEELIREGRVTVNGKVAAIGDQADAVKDRITLDGKVLTAAEKKVYILLNKPRGYLCTVSDPGQRPTVMELVRTREHLYPVGRLDFNSTGLVILTNDGDLAYRVTRAGQHCPKVYRVKVAGAPDEKKLDRLRRGILVEDERFAPCDISIKRVKPGSYTWLEVTLYQGKNRQIRRMFEAINHPVFQLKRIAIGPVTDSGLPVGQQRPLMEWEIKALKNPPRAKGADRGKKK